MQDLPVYIPTYRREAQKTWEQIHTVPGVSVFLVADKKDSARLRASYPEAQLITLPRGVQGRIGRVRQWIVGEHHALFPNRPQLVMMDDDLYVATRRQDDRGKARQSEPEDLARMFRALDTELQDLAHAGVLAREGGNRAAEHDVLYCTRAMRVLGYNTDILMREKIAMDRVRAMEDFDVCLQLLERGYENAVLCNWWQGQGNSGAAGGCSEWRTPEVQAAAAHALAALHPRFVTVVEKETKGAWGGGVRTDVRVAWKKAFRDGRAEA